MPRALLNAARVILLAGVLAAGVYGLAGGGADASGATDNRPRTSPAAVHSDPGQG
jgi:hypothetical protein